MCPLLSVRRLFTLDRDRQDVSFDFATALLFFPDRSHHRFSVRRRGHLHRSRRLVFPSSRHCEFDLASSSPSYPFRLPNAR
jgi:hypothetical protein